MNKVGALLLFTMLFNFIHSFKIRKPDIHKVTRKRSSVKSSANDF